MNFFFLLLNLYKAQAAWGLGWCKPIEEMPGFNRTEFVGDWFEMMVDLDQYIWQSKECTISTYAPIRTSNDGMLLTRNYKRGKKQFDQIEGPISISRQSNFFGVTNQVANRKVFSYEHFILDTDYENYAISYGCDNYFGIFHGRWATLLSRTNYLESQYVDKAKGLMRDIEYDFNFWWRQTGESCGWEIAPTAEQTMKNVFQTEPNWEAYKPVSSGTKRSKEMFSGETDLPQGSVIGPIQYGKQFLETPLEKHLLHSDYDEFFYLSNIAFTERDRGYVFVDIWFLSEGLRQQQIGQIKQIQRQGSSLENPICCWEFQDGAPYFIRELLSGYARVIVHHRSKGIFGFYEGHFKRGLQIDFGRAANFFPSAQWYYTEQIYIGWFPTEDKGGVGISFVDKNTVFEGQWGQSSTFPNDGEDFVNTPEGFVAHEITSFKYRVQK